MLSPKKGSCSWQTLAPAPGSLRVTPGHSREQQTILCLQVSDQWPPTQLMRWHLHTEQRSMFAWHSIISTWTISTKDDRKVVGADIRIVSVDQISQTSTIAMRHLRSTIFHSTNSFVLLHHNLRVIFCTLSQTWWCCFLSYIETTNLWTSLWSNLSIHYLYNHTEIHSIVDTMYTRQSQHCLPCCESLPWDPRGPGRLLVLQSESQFPSQCWEPQHFAVKQPGDDETWEFFKTILLFTFTPSYELRAAAFMNFLEAMYLLALHEMLKFINCFISFNWIKELRESRKKNSTLNYMDKIQKIHHLIKTGKGVKGQLWASKIKFWFGPRAPRLQMLDLPPWHHSKSESKVESHSSATYQPENPVIPPQPGRLLQHRLCLVSGCSDDSLTGGHCCHWVLTDLLLNNRFHCSSNNTHCLHHCNNNNNSNLMLWVQMLLFVCGHLSLIWSEAFLSLQLTSTCMSWSHV